MINIKNKSYGLLLLFLTAPLRASSSEEFESLCDFTPEDIAIAEQHARAAAPCSADLVVPFLNQFGIIGLLEEDFFHYTHVPNKNNINSFLQGLMVRGLSFDYAQDCAPHHERNR